MLSVSGLQYCSVSVCLAIPRESVLDCTGLYCAVYCILYQPQELLTVQQFQVWLGRVQEQINPLAATPFRMRVRDSMEHPDMFPPLSEDEAQRMEDDAEAEAAAQRDVEKRAALEAEEKSRRETAAAALNFSAIPSSFMSCPGSDNMIRIVKT